MAAIHRVSVGKQTVEKNVDIRRNKANKQSGTVLFLICQRQQFCCSFLSASWPPQLAACQPFKRDRQTVSERETGGGGEGDSKRANKSNFSKPSRKRKKKKPVTGIFVHLILCVITGLIVRDKFNFKFSGLHSRVREQQKAAEGQRRPSRGEKHEAAAKGIKSN